MGGGGVEGGAVEGVGWRGWKGVGVGGGGLRAAVT